MKHLMNRYVILTLLLSLTLGASAQKKRKTVKKPTQEEIPADPRLDRMIQNTQRIVFIDSLLVPRQEMLNKIKTTPAVGQLTQTADGFTYQNQLGTRRIQSKERRLYESVLAGNSFAEGDELKGIYTPGVVDSLACPFMMNDGLTLYFAAKGSESIGGYDLFVTRYDAESKSFLKPENLGMPFNSEADDLLYVIDEESNLGYFATSRRQPDGFVCLYTFIPNDVRHTYDALPTEQLKSRADIRRIADTWGDGQAREEALKRREAIKSVTSPDAERMAFAINDQTIYHAPTDFRAAGNQERYQELLMMQSQLDNLKQTLESQRKQYRSASGNRFDQIAQDILNTEQKVKQLEQDIPLILQDIRNAENQIINQ